MSGRRLKSYRSGDVNEDLGVFLLKSFALVAPVPRQEDVGIDAVATLLRDDGKLLIAEDSFCVQFKSSKQPIRYKGHEVGWLKSLQLPLFFGCIDRTRLEIELFGTHNLSSILIQGGCHEIVVHISPDSQQDPEDKARYVGLGTPLLKWDAHMLNDKGFADRAFDMLKGYLPTEHENLRIRGIRALRQIEWATNEWARPTRGGHVLMSKTGDRQELNDLARSLESPLAKLLASLMSEEDWQSFDKVYTAARLVCEKGGFVSEILDAFQRMRDARLSGAIIEVSI